MAQPAVRQFAGDIRMYEIGSGGALLPVIPEAEDAQGNQPIEANAMVFGYEAGDEINVVSKRRENRYNQPVYSETLPGTTTVTLTLLEIPPIILARILFGEATGATVSAGSVSDAALAVPASIVAPIQLPHRMLLADPAPVITGDSGTPTYVAGTDYNIDLRRGQVKILNGALAEETLEISYSYAAHVTTTIAGGAVPTRSFYVTGDMQDRVSGSNGELRIPQANLTVDGEVDWLSSEPIQATLTGPAIVASNEDAPYTFVEYAATA